MKTMKYFLSMAALALVGAMTVSCSSDDNIIEQPQQPETKNNVVTLTTRQQRHPRAGCQWP